MHAAPGRAILIALALVAVAAAGCGEPGGETPSSSATTTGTTTPPPERRVLTIRDHGKVVHVGLATRASLVLPERYRWRTPVVTGARVEAVEVLSDAPTGAQTWELVLSEPGVARLRTTGSPACRPTTPGCPATNRRYVVTLDIGA